MVELHKICTNLKTSKRLKELGLGWMDTGFYNVTYSTDLGDFYCSMLDGEFYNEFGKITTLHIAGFCRAYTFEQLLEVLPDIKGYLYSFGKDSISLIHEDSKVVTSLERTFHKEENHNLATTTARLLINLKENKII